MSVIKFKANGDPKRSELQDNHREEEVVDVFLGLADFIFEESEKNPIMYKYDPRVFLIWILRTDAAEILSGEERAEDAERLLSETLNHWLSLPAGFRNMFVHEIEHCYDILSHLLCAEGRGIEADEWKKRILKDS